MNLNQMFELFESAATEKVSQNSYRMNELSFIIDGWSGRIEISHPDSDMIFSLTPVNGHHAAILSEFRTPESLVNSFNSTPDDIKSVMTSIAMEISYSMNCTIHCVFRTVLSI